MSAELEFPSSWLRLKLGDIIDYGKANRSEPSEIPGDAWVLELEDIEKDTSQLLQRLTCAQRRSKSTKNRFKTGDVLYGKLRPYLNKVVIADQDGYCTTEILPLSPNEAIDGRFLFYWLKHPEFLDYVSAVSHGINMPRLGTEAGLQAPLILAPLAEQKRIADKLDALLARVDRCRTRLERVPLILKRFRQAVLAAATSGALTEDWRENGRASADPYTGFTGVSGHLDYPSSDSITDLPALPIGWKWIKTNEAGRVQLGRQRAPKYHSGQYMRPYLRVQNVFEARIDTSDIMEMDFSPSDFATYRLEYGDILLNEGQSPELLGRPAMFKNEIKEVCFTNTLIRFRAYDHISRDYALIVFRHYLHCGRFRKEGNITTNIAHLGAGRFANTEFPAPPLEEQHEIVRRVDILFAYADRLAARYQAARAQVDRLTPALLAKAFRGELVPQDPTDEPAALLLDRLRGARAG